MKTLQINEEKAKNLFKNASNEFKEMLIDTFGKKFFLDKITDRIKSYEDACSEVGITPLQLSDFSFLPEEDQKAVFAFHQLTVISKALNEEWEADWEDNNQYKWYPWFKMKAGFGFSDSG